MLEFVQREPFWLVLCPFNMHQCFQAFHDLTPPPLSSPPPNPQYIQGVLSDVRTSHLCQGDHKHWAAFNPQTFASYSATPPSPICLCGKEGGCLLTRHPHVEDGGLTLLHPWVQGGKFCWSWGSAWPGSATAEGRLEAPHPQTGPARADVAGRPTHNLLG